MRKLLFLFSVLASAASGFTQIPNAGFETWNTIGSYAVPGQWDNLNAMTDSQSTYTCEKGIPGSVGYSYMRLTSKTAGSLGIVPGVATCGILDFSNSSDIKAKSGFAYTQRPENFTGAFQFMGYGNDHGYISVLLSKWNITTNSRDTIASLLMLLTGMQMNWVPFSLRLTYLSPSSPDSCIIFLSASGTSPVENSFLYVDNLDLGSAISGIRAISNRASLVTIYPNPASGIATILYSSFSETPITISVSNINGRTVATMDAKAVTGQNKFQLNVSELAKGFYFVKVIGGQNTNMLNLLIQ